MYIFKNAFVSITRNKGRNLLIGLIVIVIACATAITLAIRNSASSLIASYENQYEITATIGVNREAMRGEMQMGNGMSNSDRTNQRENMLNIFSAASNITIEEIEKYGDSTYVKDYYYQISIGVNSKDLEAASMTSTSSNNNVPPQRPGGNQSFQNISTSDFTLVGYSKISAMQEFISGKYAITSGEIVETAGENNCVINSELAILNDIEIGDTITLIDTTEEEAKIELTVTGIFDEESAGEEMMGLFTTSVNTIITNAEVINTFTKENEDIQKTITPTFVLTEKSVIEDFSEELTEKGLSEYLTITTNLDQVEGATSTISNVNTFATTFLVITLIIGGIVLFVINMINIRERKYEIGVLRTIGMKKSLLTGQFMLELLIVSFISLLIGAGLGSISSVPVSNYLLKNEIEESQEQTNTINNNFGFGGGPNNQRFENMDRINGVTQVQAFDSIDAVVNTKVLIQLLGVGILLTLISSSASMISIQKFSPLTILKERS